MTEYARYSHPMRLPNGQTRDYVVCACGHMTGFYRWSWSGCGKARCTWCGRYVDYKTLEVYPLEKKKRSD